MYLPAAAHLQLLVILALGTSALEKHCSRNEGADDCSPEAEWTDTVHLVRNLPKPLVEKGSEEKMQVPVLEEWEMEEPMMEETKMEKPVTGTKMDEPMMLVENAEGVLRLNPDALKVLSSIEMPVVVVAVAGAARTGKSYLLNRLAGAKKGFSLASTVSSHTKGIWMWSLPHPRRADQRLILLDTEGLGDPEKGDEHNDNSVFALAILLSSLFVYNSQGTINQQSMRDLHFVTELAKRIQVKSQPDADADEEREFVRFFPDFVWTLRDLTLDLEIDGTNVTADQYLENSLRLRKGARSHTTPEVSRRDQEYNSLRRCIRDYFPSRRCFGFVCPAPRRTLRRIQELADDQLDPEFVEEFRKFSEYIYTSGKVKKVLGGHPVTGRMLSHLAKIYVDAIAKGELPCVESGIARMADLENTAAVKRALQYYDRKVAEMAQLPSHVVYQLTDRFTYYHNDAVRVFMKLSLKDDTGKHILNLEESLSSRYNSILAKIESESRQRCDVVLSEVMGLVKENLESGYYLRPGGYRELESALENGRKQFNAATVEETMGTKVLALFLHTVKPHVAQVLKVDSMLNKKENQMSALNEQLLKAEQEQQSQEERRVEEERVRTKELVRQMKEKFEEEKRKNLLEYEETMERKQAEGEKYSSENREEVSEKMHDDYEYFWREQERTRSHSFWDHVRMFCGWLWEKVQRFSL